MTSLNNCSCLAQRLLALQIMPRKGGLRRTLTPAIGISYFHSLRTHA